MTIITENETLLRFIPNVLATVDGEADLFSKIQPLLELSEQWLIRHILSEEMLPQIEAEAQVDSWHDHREGDPKDASLPVGRQDLLTFCRMAVSAYAFRLALPKLDVVLTPNGFGIVSNSNIAPASKERVERLCRELETERDAAVGSLFALLTTYDAWLTTAQAEWFAATLHPDFASLCRKVGETLSWDRYQKLRARLMLLESDIAHTHISPELYDALRREQLSQRFAHAYRRQVAEHLRTIEANALTGLPLATASLADLVQFIRTNPAIFPEWHDSETAKLFSPPVFENKKISGGYWF